MQKRNGGKFQFVKNFGQQQEQIPGQKLADNQAVVKKPLR
jgi:hypothetical protein